MLSQVGSVTTNGIRQKGDFRASGFGDMPVWPNLLAPSPVPAGTFPLFTGIRVFDRDYKNPRIASVNVGFEREIVTNLEFEANYVLSKDEDDDSNERDPFTDRTFNFYGLSQDFGPSDRDIRHRFNFYTYSELPGKVVINVRAQGRTAQPITTSPRVLNGVDRGRNWDRKDNQYFSLDWRLQRAFRVGKTTDIIPSLEMFNTLNNANNVNPLSTAGLFNFDGFLRQGVGDPRQVQLAVKVTF